MAFQWNSQPLKFLLMFVFSYLSYNAVHKATEQELLDKLERKKLIKQKLTVK